MNFRLRELSRQSGRNRARARTVSHFRSRLASRLILPLAALSLAACDTTLGVVQGVGLTQTGTFSGITGATVLSPTSVKISWDTSSQYNTYQIFSSASTVPIGNTIFSSYTITGLTPNTGYSFSVGGVSNNSSSVDGVSVSLSVQTWPQFPGVSAVTATSPTTLQVSWNYPVSGPTFNVYIAAGAAPTNFATPAVSTTSNVIGITQLADGTPIAPNTTYYVIVRATYLDNTNEFNSNALYATTPSNIQPLPTVSADKVILGQWPSINVSGGLSTYVTSFKTATQTLGSILGNGLFKTPTAYPLAPGSNTITPTVTYNGATINLPPMNVVTRTLNQTMFDFPAFSAVSGPSGSMTPRGAQRLGNAMAVGDFNCDGYQDLAVAAPWGNFNPLKSGGTGDGAVYVFFGGPAGLITSPPPSATPATPTSPLLITRPSVTTYSGANYFGASLAAGNLNADTNSLNGKGCDDLAIGTSTTNSITGVGEVWVFFGSPTGLQLGSPVQNASACNAGVCSPLVIYPPNGSWSANPSFGYSIAIGKLHTPVGGDTYKDLLIGGPSEHVAGAGYGSAWIFYGGAAGVNFINPPTSTIPYTKIVPPTATSTLSAWSTWNFGMAVAAVDLDHDNIDDVVVGAPTENTGNVCYGQGSVYYYSSKSNGGAFSASSTVTQKLTSPMNTPAAGCSSYEKFGGALANAGDVNGDGYADLIVSDSWVGWTGGWGTFGPYVYYGSTTGPQTGNGCVTSGDTLINGTCTKSQTVSCTPVGGGSPANCKILNLAWSTTHSNWYWWGNYNGIMVSGANAGVGQDVNGDGISDIIVGWPLDYASQSRADVYYGNANGLQVSPSKIKPLVLGPFDNLGWSVALGNFNGDAYSDVAVAAPDNMSLNGAYGGVVFTYNGQNGGLPTTVSGYNQMITANVSKEGYSNAWAAQAGDINGDGYTDAFAVIPRRAANRPANSYIWYSEGDLVVYYGSPNGLITSPTPSNSPLHATDPLLVPSSYGPGTTPGFGYVASAGDVNGDGFGDLVTTDGTTGYVYYGSSSGLQVAVQPAAPPATGLNPLIVASVTYLTYSDPSNWNYPGAAISAGDFNGDGFSDIAFGAYPALGQGRVLVVYGSATGPQTDGTLAHTLTGGANVVLTNPCSGTVPNLTCKAQLLLGYAEPNWAGSVAALGDVNGDGYGDLLVGSSYNSIAGTYNGAAYLFYGSSKGLLMWGATTSGLVIVPPMMVGMTGRYAGSPVAPAGDVNGDGFADILISSTHDNAGWGSSGGAFLFYGCGNGANGGPTTSGCPATGIWGVTTSAVPPLASSVAVNTSSCSGGTCQPLFFYPTGVASLTGGWPGYYWSTTLGTVGDVNKDGYSDILLGSFDTPMSCQTAACPNSYVYTGAAVLFTGSATGLTVGQGVSRVPSCNGGVCTPFWVTPSMNNWGVGGASYYSLTWYQSYNNPRPADFNGDGYPDFLITSPAYLNNSGTAAIQGGFYVFQ